MTETAAQPDRPGPYPAGAGAYWDAGWRGIIPLPAHRKKHPPEGWTGWAGAWPSWADVQEWTHQHRAGNLALRLPADVIGIDVDDYDGKPGATTYTDCQTRWGPLPDTWRTTSRDDGISGIRLYRIPEGLDWHGELPGGGVEVIHTGHRYAVAWPSIHPEGRTYRWIGPGGATSLTIPRPADLPALPAGWIVGLAKGRHDEQPRADMDTTQAATWLADLPGANTPPCPALAARTDAIIAAMAAGGSRHEAVRDRVLALIRFGEAGHEGLAACLQRTRAAFLRAVTADGTRDDREAAGEWGRLVDGAVRIIAASPTVRFDRHGDPCRPAGDRIPTITATPTDQPAAAGRTDGAHPRTSWWPVDLAPVLTGQIVQQPPTMLARTDGAMLIYPARINGIIGPSESGKTWLAMLALAQAADAGVTVLYLDFEDTAAGIVARARDLGIPDDTIAARLRYMAPDEALDAIATGDLRETLTTTTPGLIVLDGVNAAMTLLGLDLMSNRDATAFHQRILKPLAATGAGVLYVDHTPKNNADTAGGIGAQAKRAMTTGAALRVEVVSPFGRGHDGLLKVTVDKDRAGFVRGACEDSRTVGMAHLCSDPDDGTVTVAVVPEVASRDEDGNFRPTVLMRKVSEFLATIPDGASIRTILGGVSGKDKYVKTALEQLVTEGYVERSDGAHGTFLHTLNKIFREEPGVVRPSAARVRPGRGEVTAARTQTKSGPGAAVHDPGTQTTPGRTGAPGGHHATTRWIEGHLVDMDTGEILDSREPE